MKLPLTRSAGNKNIQLCCFGPTRSHFVFSYGLLYNPGAGGAAGPVHATTWTLSTFYLLSPPASMPAVPLLLGSVTSPGGWVLPLPGQGAAPAAPSPLPAGRRRPDRPGGAEQQRRIEGQHRQPWGCPQLHVEGHGWGYPALSPQCGCQHPGDSVTPMGIRLWPSPGCPQPPVPLHGIPVSATCRLGSRAG